MNLVRTWRQHKLRDIDGDAGIPYLCVVDLIASSEAHGIRMNDRLSPTERSRIMSRVRAKDTRPEMVVRRLVHSMGCRYRLHRSDLPGTPDLVLAARRRVIFVHGCFWHQHNCTRGTRPISNAAFWEAKFRANVQRDKKNVAALTATGWSVLVVWECETRSLASLRSRIACFLR